MKIFFDGGYSPAGMEYALVAGGRTYMRRDLGEGSSMAAEWLALIAALTLANDLALPEAPMGGEPPSPLALPPGCAFHPRCAFAEDRCRTGPPPSLRRADDHGWACILEPGTLAAPARTISPLPAPQPEHEVPA